MTNQTKPRIFFVDKNYENYVQCIQLNKTQGFIVSCLRVRFDVDFTLNLDESHIKAVERAMHNKKAYSAMVSHVPYQNNRLNNGLEGVDFYKDFYGRSLGILKSIKAIQPGLPIVAYTGADDIPEVHKVFLQEGPIDIIVHKTSPERWKEDFRKIEEALEALITSNKK